MSDPRVSVIVPIYNADPYLDECLDSIEKQTEQSLEIICVNDKSTDRTAEILEQRSHADNRYQILQGQGLGAGAARNLGIGASRGTYLICLDADDFFDAEFIKDAADKLDATDADILITQSYTYENDTHEEYVTDWTFVAGNIPDKDVFNYRDMQESIFNTFSNVPWNKMYKRSFVVENQMWYQQVKRTDDLLFTCLALVKAKSITTIKRPYPHYRISLTTNSTSTNEVDPLAFFEAFQSLKEELEKLGLFENVRASFVNHAIDGYYANLTSQKTLATFAKVFDSAERYFNELELGSLKTSEYLNTSQLAYIKNAIAMSLDEFIFTQLQEVTAQRDLSWKTNRTNERERWKYYDAYTLLVPQIPILEEKLHDETEARKDVEEKLQRAEDEIETILNSKAYRFGTSIATPYRKVVDALRH